MNKLTRFTVLLALSVVCLLAQNPNISSTAKVQQLFYSGALLQYVCEAPATVAATSVSVADGSLTSFTVTSNVGTLTTAQAHNLWVGAEIRILAPTTANATGTYYIRTVPSSTTYTVATTSLADGTYTAANVSISTNAPKLTDAYWYITVMHYVSTVLDGVYPGGGSLSIAYRAKCSDRASY